MDEKHKWKKGDKLRVIDSSGLHSLGTCVFDKGDIVEFSHYKNRNDDSDYVSCVVIKDKESMGSYNINRFELVEGQDNKLDKILRKALYRCKEEKIIGRNTVIDGYYVEFKFTKQKPKCRECGREME